MIRFNVEKQYWYDEQGNKVSIYLVSNKLDAKDYLETLVNCANCTDCLRCWGCSDCVDCQHCVGCTDCRDCLHCARCALCTRIQYKTDLILQRNTN